MNKIKTINNINFKKDPFKGVFKKVGEALGKKPNTVTKAFYNEDPEIVDAVNLEMSRIHEETKEKVNNLESNKANIIRIANQHSQVAA